MDDKLININVMIADRPYRMKVSADEEGAVRAVAKEINQKVKQYQQAFGSKDKQDFLAMIALENAVEGSKVAVKVKVDEPLHEKLDILDQLLSEHLSG